MYRASINFPRLPEISRDPSKIRDIADTVKFDEDIPNSPGGGFTVAGSHKRSFFRNKAGWFKAILESLDPLILRS